MPDLGRDNFVPILRQSVKSHVKHAKRLGMQPAELVLSIGGPFADIDFIYSWSDAEQEIALAWARQLERSVQ